jgi:hypothetical protein
MLYLGCDRHLTVLCHSWSRKCGQVVDPLFLMVLRKDEFGRAFPGNPSEAMNYMTVTCYSTEPIVVKVSYVPVTSCPVKRHAPLP